MLVEWVKSGFSRVAEAAVVTRMNYARSTQEMSDVEVLRRTEKVRYHLGRGRRAREAGRFDDGVREATLALRQSARDPWALALLGQCLSRKAQPELTAARRALESACAADPTNGYFVRLLLDILDTQHDDAARQNALAWAWWAGAPVDRWMDGNPTLSPLEKARLPRRSAARIGPANRVVPGMERVPAAPCETARLVNPSLAHAVHA